MLNSIFDNTATGLDITSVLICCAVGLILGLVIAMTQKITARASKNFLVTLAVLPVLTCAVMIMVNGNLGTSIAIAGAFSLVRFRSAAANSKEILSVFASMAVGLALGMGHVVFAAIVTIFVCAAVLLLCSTSILEPSRKKQLLSIVIPEDLDYTDAFSDIFAKYVDHAELVKTKTIDMGSLFKLHYEIEMKPEESEKQMLDEIRVKNCNLQVALSHDSGEEEF